MNDDREAILQLTVSYWVARCIHCAARFRWADHVHAGRHAVSEIARESGTVPELTQRILRALASIGVFRETEPGRFDLTPKAELLRSDHPHGVRDFADMVGRDLFHAWVHLDATVQGDGPAIYKTFGKDYFREIGKDPEKVQLFDRAMQVIHGPETAFVLEHQDFSSYGRFLDVGGGNGSNLYGFLKRYPRARGVLFDLPPVVDGARRTLPQDEVTARMAFEPGDFFAGVPGSADCILMRRVIHDWSDAQAATILRHAGRALSMMVIGGQERTADQYRQLATSADLRLVDLRTLPGPVDLVALERAR